MGLLISDSVSLFVSDVSLHVFVSPMSLSSCLSVSLFVSTSVSLSLCLFQSISLSLPISFALSTGFCLSVCNPCLKCLSSPGPSSFPNAPLPSLGHTMSVSSNLPTPPSFHSTYLEAITDSHLPPRPPISQSSSHPVLLPIPPHPPQATHLPPPPPSLGPSAFIRHLSPHPSYPLSISLSHPDPLSSSYPAHPPPSPTLPPWPRPRHAGRNPGLQRGSGGQPGKEAASAGETHRQTRTHGHRGKGIARHARYTPPTSLPPTCAHMRPQPGTQSPCHSSPTSPSPPPPPHISFPRLGTGHTPQPQATRRTAEPPHPGLEGEREVIWCSSHSLDLSPPGQGSRGLSTPPDTNTSSQTNPDTNADSQTQPGPHDR